MIGLTNLSYNVLCLMCGRKNGKLVEGEVHKVPNAPKADLPLKSCRCGFCGGGLYLELTRTT